MNVLDLFSGIGGFSLGLERAGMKTVAFCEIDPFCRKILNQHWSQVPVYDDIQTLNAERLQKDGIGAIDVICGGFPCQPFSVAGQQRGKEDHRDLWPEMFRLIKECKPSWCIGENVAGFIDMALERTAIDLESQGYEVQPIVIPACAVGAPHRRDRVWIIAYNNSIGRGIQSESREQQKTPNFNNDGAAQPISNANCERCRQGSNNWKERSLQNEWKRNDPESKPERQGWEYRAGEDGAVYANPSSEGLQGLRSTIGGEKTFTIDCFPSWREIKPTICGSNHGIPGRMDRLKALGNAVVPQIPEIIGRAIMDITYDH